MYTPVNPVLPYKGGRGCGKGGQNYIGMFSWCGFWDNKTVYLYSLTRIFICLCSVNERCWICKANSSKHFQNAKMRRLAWMRDSAWQNLQNGMWAQRRLRSAMASAQSDQSLRWAHMTWHFVGFVMRWLMNLFKYGMEVVFPIMKWYFDQMCTKVMVFKGLHHENMPI